MQAVKLCLLQQNPPVLNWVCQLTQVVLHNGHKTAVVVAVVGSFQVQIYIGSLIVAAVLKVEILQVMAMVSNCHCTETLK